MLDHALINSLDAVEVHSLGFPDVAAVLVRELRISPGEAKARARAAADLGPRVTSAGEVIAPVFAPVAAAQAAGVISVEHAAVIRRTIDDLPDAVEAAHGDALQAQLVERGARVLNPADLAEQPRGPRRRSTPTAGFVRRRDRTPPRRLAGASAVTACWR